MPRHAFHKIVSSRCIINDNTPHVIYDVYGGDDARDWMMLGYRAMVHLASFRTRAEAEAFCIDNAKR